jgi:fermentation-respiration switch protein FrsA (DUF1100 family)
MRLFRLIPISVGLLSVVVLPGCESSPRVADVSPKLAAFSDEDLAETDDESESSPIELTAFQSAKSRSTMRTLDELILFQPAKYPAGDWSPKGLQFEDVELKSADGTKLHAWFCPCENARASVLFLHGNAGHLASRAEFMKVLQKDLKVAALIVDYRGYGKSEGKPTIDGAIADVRAASRELASRTGVKEKDLIVWGRSLGGALAVQLAAQTQPRGIIVQSSFSSLKEVAAEHFPKLAWMVGKKRLNSAETIAKFKGSLLQCHGTNDRVISFESGNRLFKAANEPKRFLKLEGLGHNDQTPTSFILKADELIATLSDTPEVLVR